MKFSEKVGNSIAENQNRKLKWPIFIERFENIRITKFNFNSVPIYIERGQTEDVGMNFYALTIGHILYNTRSKPNNHLAADFELGCSLRYEQKYNGSIVCKLIGFDGEEYLYGTYSSPESIGVKRIYIHIKSFEAILFCTSIKFIPSFSNKLIFLLIKANNTARTTPITQYLGTLISAISKMISGK